MNTTMMLFYCPNCKQKLVESGNEFVCPTCNRTLFWKDKVLIDRDVVGEKDKEFYDNIYAHELGEKWFQGLNRKNIFKRILEIISLSYRRERFFKRELKGPHSVILDLACGAGRNYFKKYGMVVGVDLSYEALALAKNEYDLVIQGGVTRLPFEDNTFDYVTSSDFFGHVRNEDKDAIMEEIYRVLKPGGKTLHIIENDSNNIWFRFAHRYPDLFQKYFIEKIGGHVGLELPDVCVEHWQKNKFTIVEAKKLWGTIWPIQDYAYLFNNEYKEKSRGIRIIVLISKFFGSIKLLQAGVNIILNPINSLVEKIMPFNNGQALMLVAEKKSEVVYTFSSEPTGTHALLLDQIRSNTTVLDIGASTGYLGEYLIREKKCRVWGVESDEKSLVYAKAKGYENVVNTNIESALQNSIFQEKKFDHIIIGDVLEHLVDPVSVLKNLKSLLNEQGTVVISLPNVGHYSIRKNLLFGRWDMTATGIMDRTHLHFYTHKTARDLIEQAGYTIELVRPRGDLERWFRCLGIESIGKKILYLFQNFFAVQFIFVARSKKV